MQEEKVRLSRSLGATENENLIKRALDFAMSVSNIYSFHPILLLLTQNLLKCISHKLTFITKLSLNNY